MVFWVCASEPFAFALAASSDGMPRAVKRAGGARAPSTPGRLWYREEAVKGLIRTQL